MPENISLAQRVPLKIASAWRDHGVEPTIVLGFNTCRRGGTLRDLSIPNQEGFTWNEFTQCVIVPKGHRATWADAITYSDPCMNLRGEDFTPVKPLAVLPPV